MGARQELYLSDIGLPNSNSFLQRNQPKTIFDEVVLVTSTCNKPSRSVRYKPNLQYNERTAPTPYKLHPNLYELAQVRFGTLLGIKEFQLR